MCTGVASGTRIFSTRTAKRISMESTMGKEGVDSEADFLPRHSARAVDYRAWLPNKRRAMTLTLLMIPPAAAFGAEIQYATKTLITPGAARRLKLDLASSTARLHTIRAGAVEQTNLLISSHTSLSRSITRKNGWSWPPKRACRNLCAT